MILTYPSVAGSIFTFLPFPPPVGSTHHQWVEGSIIPHRISSMVFNEFAISV